MVFVLTVVAEMVEVESRTALVAFFPTQQCELPGLALCQKPIAVLKMMELQLCFRSPTFNFLSLHICFSSANVLEATRPSTSSDGVGEATGPALLAGGGSGTDLPLA